MAMPDSARNNQVRPESVASSAGLAVTKAMAHAKIKITVVRIAVARFESTPATPTLASTAVRPAKSAESNDQVNQFIVDSKQSVGVLTGRSSIADQMLFLNVEFPAQPTDIADQPIAHVLQ